MIRSKTILFIVLALCIGGISGKAQNISLVPELSIGSNQYSVRAAGQKTQKSSNGIYLGLGAGLDLPYNEHLTLRLSAVYAARGGSYTESMPDSPYYQLRQDLIIDEVSFAGEVLYVKRLKRRSLVYGGMGVFSNLHLKGIILATLMDKDDNVLAQEEVNLKKGSNKKNGVLSNNNYGLKVRVGFRFGKHQAVEIFTKLGIKDLDNDPTKFSSIRTDDVGLTWSYSIFFE